MCAANVWQRKVTATSPAKRFGIGVSELLARYIRRRCFPLRALHRLASRLGPLIVHQHYGGGRLVHTASAAEKGPLLVVSPRAAGEMHLQEAVSLATTYAGA